MWMDDAKRSSSYPERGMHAAGQVEGERTQPRVGAVVTLYGAALVASLTP